MRVTTLIDNRPAPQLTAEWGLAFWIEYQDNHILLDTGGGENFARNAAALGIYLSRADFAVLSHAHWDHAGPGRQGQGGKDVPPARRQVYPR